MTNGIAVINAGSSSIKFGLYDADKTEAPILKGQIEKLNASSHLLIRGQDRKVSMERNWPPNTLDHAHATMAIVKAIKEIAGTTSIVAVGHRVVHGGATHSAPVRIGPGIVDELDALAPLAPLHQPHNLAPIRAISDAAPDLLQVACFDTAFHRTQPPLAQMVGLPRKFTDAGIRRYGFHGLSYEYVTRQLESVTPSLAGGRLIVAHLGNGASLCAIRTGKSIATTMGFTALDGLLMGTRCGSLDPGILLYLSDIHGLDIRALEDLLYRQSGLLGVSGISSDMRELRASADPAAADAVALFVYRIVREIGSLAAALGGIDGLVFTGGIGENDAVSRAEVVRGCSWLGIELDDHADVVGDRCISAPTSRVSVWVVPTDEEAMIAAHTKSIREAHLAETIA